MQAKDKDRQVQNFIFFTDREKWESNPTIKSTSRGLSHAPRLPRQPDKASALKSYLFQLISHRFSSPGDFFLPRYRCTGLRNSKGKWWRQRRQAKAEALSWNWNPREQRDRKRSYWWLPLPTMRRCWSVQTAMTKHWSSKGEKRRRELGAIRNGHALFGWTRGDVLQADRMDFDFLLVWLRVLANCAMVVVHVLGIASASLPPHY